MCCAPHQSTPLTASPQGEAYIKGIYLKFQTFATVRYETGDARPGGRLYHRHIFKISNGLQQSVTKRATPSPRGEGFIIG